MHPHPTAHVPAPDLAVEEDGAVTSPAFGDVYFSRVGGVAETQHVFLAGNDLPQRWQQRAEFTIGELGFGTGLNFLVAQQEFLRTTDATQHLHYMAVEKFPLTQEQFQALGVRVEDTALETALQAAYPLRLPGWHQIHLKRTTLTLGIGDAASLLQSLDAQVDAWFLDGFAPAKNPDMWGDDLLDALRRVSGAKASVATFTAAGFVRRALQARGFAMKKLPGFGNKREMLAGVLELPVAHCAPLVRSRPAPVVIIGAGIAGATLARALAERGVAVTVLEAGTVAEGASGNPAGALYPQLTKFYTPATVWHATGYGLMLRHLARWQREGLVFTAKQIGMLRIPRSDGHAPEALLQTLQMDTQIARAVTRDEASRIAGVEVAHDAIWLPHGTWIRPAELCAALLQHAHIMLHTQCAAKTLQRHQDKWRVVTDTQTLDAAMVCVATAQHAAQLLPQHCLPMGISAGQVSRVDSPLRESLRCMISHHGYVVPMEDAVLLGATYDREDMSGVVSEKNHAENIAHARAALPAFDGAILDGRTRFRAGTRDRLPYVGALEAGLFVSTGFGSRGMISAPLAAEIIVAQMTGATVPLARDLLAAVSPLRSAAGVCAQSLRA